MRMITTAAVAGSVLAGLLLAPVAASAAPFPQHCAPYQSCGQNHDRGHHGMGHHRGHRGHDHYGPGRGPRW